MTKCFEIKDSSRKAAFSSFNISLISIKQLEQAVTKYEIFVHENNYSSRYREF